MRSAHSRRPRPRTFLAAVLLVPVPPLPPAQASTKAVRIEKQSPTSEVMVYDPEAPDQQRLPPRDLDQDAITICDYWCKPVLAHRTLATSLEPGGCVATIEVLESRIILELSMITWLPEEASKTLRRHEAAHRDICERVYHRGEHATRETATRLIGRPVRGEGSDCKRAVNDAVSHTASNEICGLYSYSRGEAAQRIVAIYDSLVRSGQAEKMSVRTAIRAAFEHYHRDLERGRAAETSAGVAP